MSSLGALLWLSLFTLNASASPVSSPAPSLIPTAALNVTLPAHVGWYDPPNLRGTIDILWSCLSTLFVCLWVVLQLNIPAPHDGSIAKFRRKAKWMFLGFGAPEYLFMVAMIQLHDARRARWEMHKRGYMKWTITHGFYVNMGGLVIDVAGRRRFPVTYKQLIALLDRGGITLPALSEDEIKDKSKADWFAKTVSCVQAGWLIVQCIGRAKQHLPLSTLELTTLVFVMNSLLVYTLWWYKPTDVEVPTIVCIDGKTDKELRELIGQGALLWDGFFTGKGEEDIIEVHRVYNDSDLPPGVVDGPAVYCITAVTMAYGALHCAAWNFDFPTAVERTMWRICGPLTIFVLPVGMIPGSWLQLRNRNLRHKLRYLVRGMAWPAIGLYTFSRAYLLVESFISLRSLPAGAYETVQWTNFIPHV